MLREYNEIKEQIKNSVLHIKTVESYCVSCEENTANENSSDRETTEDKLMVLSNCAVCDKKKSTFIKNQVLNNFNNS